MGQIRTVKLSDGTELNIEFDDKDFTQSAAADKKVHSNSDLPPGSEPTGLKDKAFAAFESMISNVKALSEEIKNGLDPVKPSEISLELKIGFAGKADVIPYIASGSTDAAIKLNIKWKHSNASNS